LRQKKKLLTDQRNDLQRLQQPLAVRTYKDYRTCRVVHWLLATGRFPEFHLAER
jgi:hypothetical protein